MDHSLQMLAVLDLPGHDQDVQDLASHRKLLLDSIEPRLKAVIDSIAQSKSAGTSESSSVETLCELASVYHKMGQPDIFAMQYSKYRTESGASQWSAFDPSTDGADYPGWLSRWLSNQCQDLFVR